MATVVLIALGFLFCQAQTQLCGPGVFPGPLSFDNGLYPGPLLGQLGKTTCGLPSPPCACGISPPPCGIPTCGSCGPQIQQCGTCGPQIQQCGTCGPQIQQCGTCGPQIQQCGTCGPQIQQCGTCGPQIQQCGTCGPQIQQCGPCGPQFSQCGFQVPSCDIQIAPCIQVPQCGVQIPQCGVQIPQCGVQIPQCNIQIPQCNIPQCGIQLPQCGVQIPACGIQVPQCGIQLPSCGVQAPMLNSFSNLPCGCSPFAQNLSPIISSCAPACDCGNQVAIVDNTLANSLANAIQLLIVSNLLESSQSNPCSVGYSCENAFPCSNVIEVFSPEYPCNQIVTCEPCYQEPISFATCIETPCCNCIGDLGFDFSSFSVGNGLDNCGLVNPFAKSFGCAESCCGIANPFSNVAAEVVFPSEIPAQLTCNFGYMPTTVPCVSVNVEPLSCGSFC